MDFLKKHLTVSNLIWLALVIWLGSRWYQTRNHEQALLGTPVHLESLIPVDTTAKLTDQKAVNLVFWASWCAPCSIELKRIKAAVLAGELDPNSVLAISLDSNFTDALSYKKKHELPFPTYYDQRLLVSKQAQVMQTPTMIKLNRSRRITAVYQGLSPFLISRLQEAQ